LVGFSVVGLLIVAILVIVFFDRSPISDPETPSRDVMGDSSAASIRQTMEQGVPDIITVRVEDPLAPGITRGFFTEKGYIVAFMNSESTEVDVVWTSDGEEKREKAAVVQRGTLVPEEVVLLELIDATPPQVQYPILLSTSLK
jgi:hypothetical protein